ncbi:conserved oligomeric Golgi complex subunit 7 [Vanessa tameamea]|uniref:Conserved oligomeric Golgi complex subunit 7 n=1 Tax=Vanessa tameamea TaxID=334116 RepID=A0A8B8IQU8_VANTA
MDLKTFADNEFDPKKWINKAWSTSGNQEKEIFVVNTVTRLQLYMKQLSNSLDETTTQIVTSIPRVLQDASTLQLEGALLQQKLVNLEEQVQGVEEQTGHSIKSLQKIDQLKSRLENAASTLREADKWVALATSLEDILEAGVPTQKEKLMELGEQVTAMTASLEALSESSDYEMKRMQLETLYNRLEAAISSPLIDALTQMDAERTRAYASVFRGMSRGAAARVCWRRAAAGRRAAGWARAHEHSLRALTRMLAEDASTQVDWLTSVLKSDQPLAELVRLYTDLLLSLDPSPTKIVTANFKMCQTPEEGLTLLIDLKTDIDEFIDCIRNVIEAPRPSKDEVPQSSLRDLGRALCAPLRALLPRYTDLQTAIFLGYLDEPQVKQEDLLEQSRALLSVAERSEVWLSTAYTRGKKIAGTAIYPFYAPSVEAFTSAVSSLISGHTRRIEARFQSAVSAGRAAGVLCDSFPASLALEHAAAELLDRLAERQRREGDEDDPKTDNPLLDLPTMLLDAETRQQPRTSPPSVAALRRARDTLKGLARSILRHPIDVQLEKIPQLSVWHNNDALSTDLPDFALSPQEYITEIGQYLMTLPQHLEMYLSENQAPWQFLTELCTHTCEVYAEKILNIQNMDALGTKRCLTDIVYLSSVVEDLGSSITPALKNLEKSLRAATPSQNE